MNELQKTLLENELRRHYIHELLGKGYEALVRFMQTILEVDEIDSNSLLPTSPQSKSLQ